MATLADRLMSFVVERYPFALPAVRRALESCDLSRAADQKSIEDLRPQFCQALGKSLGDISVNGPARHDAWSDRESSGCRLRATSSSTRATAF